MIESIGGGWGDALVARMSVSDREAIEGFLARAWKLGTCPVYPSRAQVFTALEKTSLDQVRAVILGQDPYPNSGQACGLAFSVPEVLPPGVRRPQSLGRILSEVRREGYSAPRRATLERWTDRDHGVLLLNTALTVCDRAPGSHKEMWKPFTKAVIQLLVERPDPIAFLLWGKHAQKWSHLIRPPHEAVSSPHPAARGKAAGFACSSPFSRANSVLGAKRKIDWSLS